MEGIGDNSAMRAWVTPSSHLHQVPAGFPEIPDRLDWAVSASRDAGLRLDFPSPEDLGKIDPTAVIRTVHLDNRQERLREAAVPWRARIDTADCPVSPGTPEAALAAVRTTLFGLEELLRDGGSGVALVRPPGHHATRRLAMGFCYLNNLALAASAALETGRRRPAILDFDVHHGNGTQEIFYEDENVFFCSLHEDPRTQYPGTGFPEERGAGPGIGTTLNLSYATGSEAGLWMAGFLDRALPALERFGADILLISAGFDAHRADPIGGLKLGGEDFRRIGEETAALVRSAGIPALLVLEGGYDPLCFSDGLRPLMEGWQSRG